MYRFVGPLLAALGLAVAVAVGQARPWEPYNAADTLHAYYACYANALLLPPSGWRLGLRFGGPLGGSAAATTISLDYYTVVTQVDTAVLAAASDAERRELAVHELWHVVLRELAEVARAVDTTRGRVAEERLVSRVSRWPFWQRMCLWRPAPALPDPRS